MHTSEATHRRHLILVVEDEDMIRDLLREHLSDVGFEVLSAANADEARNILATEGAIELVLTDVNMPGSMDGAQLAAWIHESQPTLPVILVSGKATIPAREADRRWFLRKPFELAAVERRIRQLLD